MSSPVAQAASLLFRRLPVGVGSIFHPSRKLPSRHMKYRLHILLLLACLTLAARASSPAGWSTSTNEISGTPGSKQPVLVFFTADWCTYCKLMERTTMTNDAVKEVVTNMTHIVVDIDAHQDLAEKYGIDGVPTFLLLSDTGTEVRRSSSFQPAPDFLRWLTNGVTEAQAAIARREAFEKQIAGIDQLLSSTNTEAYHQAALQLFTVCAERDDSIARAAADRLKKVATHDPAALVDGLVDPRLAARIQIANALRDHFGETFDFDPWAELAERSKSAQQWRAKLEKP
jgi:thioredoxin-like negative regulator of GroEL